MAGNYPELWQARVEHVLTNTEAAPWLDGVDELEGEVQLIGENSATEKMTIHLAATDFEPDVLINNTTYPLAVQEYEDESISINLDKYQPKVVTLSDDQAMGSSYSKIDAATRSITSAILKKKYGKAIHAIAPAGHTTATPVLLTTGDDDGSGRKRMLYDDLVAFRKAIIGEDGVPEGLTLVLNSEHYHDILLDRKNFGDQLVNYRAGQPAPEIAGFKIFTYGNNPYYTVSTKVKKAYGSAPATGDRRASVAFVKRNIGKKTGATKQYYLPASMNTRSQANELGYRHYFVALPKQAMLIGAMVSADVA